MIARRIDLAALAAMLWLGGGIAASAQMPPPPEGAPTTPALTRLFERGGRVDRVATGFGFAQDLIWDGEALLVADRGRGQLLRVGTPTRILLPEQGLAALAYGPDGQLIAVSGGRRRLLRMGEDLRSVLVEQEDQETLIQPVDLAVAPDGRIFVADLADGSGRIIAIGPDRARRIVIDDLERPAGLALAPDGQTLYVSDAGRSELRAYPVSEGEIGEGRRLASIVPWKAGVRGVPEKMTLDRDGRIYLAGPGGIWVLDRRGGRLGVIATPETPTACAFGDPDGRTLYIAAPGSVYKVRLKVEGAAMAGAGSAATRGAAARPGT
ncbi:MAG TPA: SMP-30/gluconolactonase/LRE family protein [Vicinamibacterales bacterium]